jgi:aspartate/methionine/tyrosine aminotransferase
VRSAPDTLALCEQLVREHQVDVVPGEFFGRPGHVRVGCGVAPALLEQASRA